MANRIFDLPQTRGTFEAAGVVNGTDSNRFFTEKKTKNGNDFVAINFGVEYDTNCSIYMNLNGMPRDKVYFSKRNDQGKNETKSVPWANRNNSQGDGWRMIGINVGVTKTTDSNGKVVNDKMTLAEYDAVKHIHQNLKDGYSVYVRGNIEYDSYADKEGNKRRNVKYIPSQVSLCQDVIFEEFDGDKKKPKHAFTQTIVYMGIDKEKDDTNKDTGRYVVSAKIVNYNNIQDVEYIIEDSKLANLFRKNLKAYNSIEVHGHINVSHNIETVSEDDGWGVANEMQRVSSPTKVELIIMGASPATIDRDTYTANNVEEAMKKIIANQKAKASFGEQSKPNTSVEDWGSDDDDEDEPW